MITAGVSLDACEAKIEKIIRGDYPLRPPCIAVIHLPYSRIREVYQAYYAMMGKFQTKYHDWKHEILNLEKVLFQVLREMGYTDPDDQFALEESRETLKDDMKSNGVQRVLEIIEEHLDRLDKENAGSKTPVLLIGNMHACYPFIHTGDVISRVFNQQKVLLLILYADDDFTRYDQESEIKYKHSNYNVRSYLLKF